MNILVNPKDTCSDLSKTCEIAAPWKPIKFQIYASLYVTSNQTILDLHEQYTLDQLPSVDGKTRWFM